MLDLDRAFRRFGFSCGQCNPPPAADFNTIMASVQKFEWVRSFARRGSCSLALVRGLTRVLSMITPNGEIVCSTMIN